MHTCSPMATPSTMLKSSIMLLSHKVIMANFPKATPTRIPTPNKDLINNRDTPDNTRGKEDSITRIKTPKTMTDVSMDLSDSSAFAAFVVHNNHTPDYTKHQLTNNFIYYVVLWPRRRGSSYLKTTILLYNSSIWSRSRNNRSLICNPSSLGSFLHQVQYGQDLHTLVNRSSAMRSSHCPSL